MSHSRRWSLVIFFVIASAASFGAPTVFNSSFEAPDTVNEDWAPSLAAQGGAGWDFTVSPQAGVVQDNNVAYADFAAAAGTQMGTIWTPGAEIAQTISGFEIGETYTISWSERARQSYTGHLWVLMDSVTLDAAHAVSDASWVEKNISFTATLTSHRLRFYHSDGGVFDSMTHVDDVGISVVPEPASFTLLGGFACLTLVMLRRRR